MTFDVNERSSYSGMPVALYDFVFGTAEWFYTSDEEAITLGGDTYQPIAISDTGPKQSGDATSDEMIITLPKTVPVAVMLNGQPPSETIWVNIRHYHHGDDGAPIIWSGYIDSRKQVSTNSVEISCKMLTAGFDRNGLRLTFVRQCPHALYDQGCKVNKDLFAVTFQVDSLNGNTIFSDVIGTLADGYFSNGFFTWTRFTGAVERRGIEEHVGDHFTILGTSAGIAVGDWITAYPGCARTRTDCINKFNNLSNYGGFPHLPGKSPFQGDPVF
ncbi:putative tail assembly protein [Rhizobium phage RHph_X2_30]|nr:putative tail assembly protein [Rhizobium phage RHph_X2_30]